MVKERDIAPDFRLLDDKGIPHTLSQYAGKYVLVYFYPKDDTPGCTTEACTLRDAYADFERLGVVVIGISKDSTDSHKKFAEKYNLPFILLSDPERIAITAYGARGGVATRRISYLIGPDGKVIKAYPKVDPAAHAGEILADLLSILK